MSGAASSTTLIHAGVVLVGIVAYTVLTALGHDGNPVLTAAIAWGGAAVTDRAISAGGSDSPRPPAQPGQ